MSDSVICIENLSKKYFLGKHGGADGLRHVIHDFVTTPLRWLKNPASGPRHEVPATGSPVFQDPPVAKTFWALKNVSFEVKQGEVIGIIGGNGAGKSTLLKILSRITEQTEGRVEITGRVASLLEVGTGFHPELTGRENVFLNGAILGMNRVEIKKKFDEIVAFAEVEKFLDTPVKRYSSGMYVRLAFAVAAHLEPEILIVDEVLAVGDVQFQKKCMGKMQDVASGGRTILFVSHNMGAIMALCKKAVWLAEGKCRMIGTAQEVGNAYLSKSTLQSRQRIELNAIPRSGSDGARARIIAVEWLEGLPLRHGCPVGIKFEMAFLSPEQDVRIGIGFSTIEGVRIVTYDSDSTKSGIFSIERPSTRTFELHIESLPLNPGLYSIDVGCRSGEDHTLDYLRGAGSIEVVLGPETPAHYFGKESAARLEGQWKSISTAQAG